MMCFDVESIENIIEPPEQIETTSLYGETRTYIPAIMNPTTLIVTGKELVKLDTTTMKRIARYNLEEENAALLKKIEERKKVIADSNKKNRFCVTGSKRQYLNSKKSWKMVTMMRTKINTRVNGSDVKGITRTFVREKQSKPITRKGF